MNLQEYTFQIISVVLGSASIGALITAGANMGKNKAETNNLVIEGYKELLDDLRITVQHQGEQIKTMQGRELELLKIITNQQQTERDLRAQIKALEIKLSKRLDNIENHG